MITNSSDSLFSVENVLAVVDGAKRDGNSYIARCPVPEHVDRNPSLRISKGRNGDAVVYCFGCTDKQAAFQVILDRINEGQASAGFAPAPADDLEAEEGPDFDARTAGKELIAWQEEREDVFNDRASQFLQQRGVSEGVASRLGYGFDAKRNALVIPTYWNDELIGVKFRSIALSPGLFKWWQLPGSQQDVLMGADLAPVVPDCKVVAVFEAPLDMALVHSLGFNAVTLISANIKESDRFLSGVGSLKERFNHVLLIGDNDESGVPAMSRMQELIGPGAAFARLPRDFKDIGDFYQARPEDARGWLRWAFDIALECPPIPRGTLGERLEGILKRAVQTVSPPNSCDPLVIIPALKRELSDLEPPDADFPRPLSADALIGALGEFVTAALPFTEASAEALAYQFLVAMGNCLGTSVYANFGTDRHYPALFALVVGNTASGKGQSLSAVRWLMHEVDSEWVTSHWKSSAASGEGLVRLASEGTADGRLFLTLPEISTMLNSMNRDGSNLSGYLRLAYDRAPLENQKSKGGIVARDYLLSTVGHITPAELSEILDSVDFYNGAVNRFLWVAVKKSKTVPRMEKTPDFEPLAKKLQRLIALPPVGQVAFSEDANATWDQWVYSLPELDGKLDAACARSKPNALRLALIYAALDYRRLTSEYKTEIQVEHVKAAIEVVSRSRESVAWFLSRSVATGPKASYDDIQKVRNLVNSEGGRITSTQLCRLFPHKTADERVEIASRTGLKLRKAEAGKNGGRPADLWAW